MPEIILNGQRVGYSVRESARARQARLRIDAQKGLQIIVPAGRGQPASVEALLRSRADWILRHLARFAAAAPPRQYVSGEKLLVSGVEHTLEVVVKPNGSRASVSQRADALRVTLPPGVAPDAQPEAVRAALESWFRARAKACIPQRAAELAPQIGVRYERITIKGQSTRWGSCSSKNNLNFNWRLMMAPPGAVDYVIIHELCHLKELNHSPRFWALVAQHCPDYRRWERWLKVNIARLRG